MGLGAGFAQAQGPGGRVLSQLVRLPAGWVPLAQVLAEASRQSGVPISYSSTRVATSRRVYVPAGPPRPLGAILHDALSPQHVSYGLLSGQVVLWPARKVPPPGVTDVNGRGIVVSGAAGSAAWGVATSATRRKAGTPITTPAEKVAQPSDNSLIPGQPHAPSHGGVNFAARKLLGPHQLPHNLQADVAPQPRITEQLGHHVAPIAAAGSASTEARLVQQPAVDPLAVLPVQATVLPIALPNSLPLVAPVPLPAAAGLRRKLAQFSLIYPLSTNGLANARTTNWASLNALVGYAAGVDGVELGVLANVVRDSVHGTQIAGYYNVTGTDVRGVQVAGVANFTGGGVFGVQGAGLTNIVRDDARGFQLAGLVNIVGGAGLARAEPRQPTRLRRWLGLPRLLATNKLARSPAAPSTNAPGLLLQMAGLANLTGTDVRGVQTAILLNVARRVHGVQFGLVNTARHVRGLQLGLINIADSVDGVPLGIINIVRHGYVRGEIWASETLPLNVMVKTGVRRYYTLLGVSAQPFGNRIQWTVGFGIGTAGRAHGRFTFGLDAIEWGLAGAKSSDSEVPVLYQVRPSVAWQMEREGHLQLVVSPTLNLAFSRRMEGEPDWDFAANQLLFIDRAGSKYLTRLWPGAQIGLRF